MIWAPGGQVRVVFEFIISGGKIVAIEMIADPEHLAQLEEWLRSYRAEELFDAELNLVASNENHVGEVSGFARPATSTASTTPPTQRRSRSTSTEPT